jgi:hypothetical protein
MTDASITLQQVLDLARKLTPLDKIRLIEGVAPDLETFLSDTDRTPSSGGTLGDLVESPLCGLWGDRTDIEDSVQFAHQLRTQAERRTHG